MDAPEQTKEEAPEGRNQLWPGLAPFREDTCYIFFGRNEEIEALYRRVARGPLTVLYGKSGIGKTSLLRAGLFPYLRKQDYLPVYIHLDHGEKAPSLLAQTLFALREACGVHAIDVPDWDEIKPCNLWEYFHHDRVDFWNRRNRLVKPILIFDQFEEMFASGMLAAKDNASRLFLEELAAATENRPPAATLTSFEADPDRELAFDYQKQNCKAVFSVREDFWPEIDGLSGLFRAIPQNRYRLLPMKGTQALDAVLKSAEDLVDDTVARQIVSFVGTRKTQQGSSPIRRETLAQLEVEPALLSMVFRELNLKRIRAKQARITEDLVSQSKTKILSDFYEQSFTGIDARVRIYVEDRLLTGDGYRQRAAKKDAVKGHGITESQIETLVDRRLLRFEESAGVVWVELTHDLLTDVASDSRKRRRQQKARTVLIRQYVGVGVLFVAIVCVLGGITHNALRMAAGEREAALSQAVLAQKSVTLRKQTENLVGIMVFDLRDKLTAAGRLPLMESANAAVEAHLDKLADDDLTEDLRRLKSVVYDNKGKILLLRGEVGKALKAYRTALAIVEKLASGDPANTVFQTDRIALYARLGRIYSEGESRDEKQQGHYLQKGLRLLMELKADGRLSSEKEAWIPWFEARLNR